MKSVSLVVLLGLSLWCLGQSGDAQVAPTKWTKRQELGVIDSKITLPQAPLQTGLIAISTECGYQAALSPVDVASQWIYAGKGCYVGLPPFNVAADGTWTIRGTRGRTAPKIPLTILEWAP